MMRITALTILFWISMSACTVQPAAEYAEQDCVRLDYIKSWLILDKRHAMVWSRRNPKGGYLLLLRDDLPDTDTWSAKYIDFDGNKKLCGYGGDKIIVAKSRDIQIPTIIASVRRLDEAEMQNLSEQYHVNLLPKKLQDPKSIFSSERAR